jgi:mRNA interferase MazF
MMTMPNMTTFEFGDIVLLSFPFTDQQGAKQRPAVVISSIRYNQERPDVILMAITSRIRDTSEFGHLVLDNWEGAGLIKPSAIKPVLFSVENALIRKKLGKLAQQDATSLRAILSQIIG